MKAVPVSTVVVESKDRKRLAHLHESLATLLASRGQWRQAYEHLRSALDLSRGPDGTESAEAQSPEGLRRELERLRRAHAEAREQSMRDSLTASYNRRYLDQRLDDLMASRPQGTGLAVALVDLDFFKQVNDTHGHQLGDLVLQRVVEILQDGLPEDAFCARYGGEEFVLVMPDISEAGAVVLCETARARVEHHPWHQLVAGLRVTVSIGVAHRDERTPARAHFAGAPGRRVSGVPELLVAADQLLYQAKQSGRNAVAFLADGAVALAGMAARRRAGPGGTPAPGTTPSPGTPAPGTPSPSAPAPETASSGRSRHEDTAPQS